MAGDWIKMRTDLRDDPAVIATAAALNMEEDHVVGKLHRLWSWANQQTADGNAHGVTKEWLDRYIGVTGFSQALSQVGWLECDNGGICIPNFDRHNSQSAKQRAVTLKRVKRYRKRTKALPEKRREEKREEPLTPLDANGQKPPTRDPIREPHLPEGLRAAAFCEAWTKWVKHRADIKKPLKPTQVEAQLKMLAGLGLSRAVAMIDHTVAMGWQGLREREAKAGKPPAEVYCVETDPHRKA